jgi:small subunit ribosomal protein S16
MLKIRLQRVGRKNDPSFRLVLTDSKNATRSGKFLEILGSYSARQGEPVVNGDRVKYWMSVGAKPSGTVHNLLIAKKILTGKKINVLPKKTAPKKEAKEEVKAVTTPPVKEAE